MQTTWIEQGTVNGREALLPRSVEVQPLFGRFSDWTPLSRLQSPSPFLLAFATGWVLQAGSRIFTSAPQICATLPSFDWAPPPQRARRGVPAEENAMSIVHYRVGTAAGQQPAAIGPSAFLRYRVGGLCRCARNSAKQGPLPRLPPQHVSPSLRSLSEASPAASRRPKISLCKVHLVREQRSRRRKPRPAVAHRTPKPRRPPTSPQDLSPPSGAGVTCST